MRSLRSHFYVLPVEYNEQHDWGWSEEISFSEQSSEGFIDKFLVLLHEDISVHDPLLASGEPHIDYSIGYNFTFDEFVASLEAKATCKQTLLKEGRVHKTVVKVSKEKRKFH